MILATLYEDMANTIPLVFVLSPGSDPMSSFLRFAKEMGYAERCGVCVSGGGGAYITYEISMLSR